MVPWQPEMHHHVLLCPVPGSGPAGRALYGTPPWGCTGPVHWLIHGLGIDSQVSYFYDFTSGSGPMLLTLLLGAGVIGGWFVAYRKLTCEHSFWCARHRLHDLTDPDTSETHRYCHRHFPGKRSHHWHPAERLAVWERHLAHQRAAE